MADPKRLRSDSPRPARRFATVCSSNFNRSMEAHKQLLKKDLQVESFGVGTMVRLPGPNGAQQTFAFGTPYEEIREKLLSLDEGDWYRNTGLLAMVDRNCTIKHHPERWQALPSLSGRFDVVFCFEERVFEAVLEDVRSREPEDVPEPSATHIINLETVDNAEEAIVSAQICQEFCVKVADADNLDDEVPQLVEEFSQRIKRTLDHLVVYL
jgi:RNA polymerase II subunit A C-terminal domain phosphatase SSU72